MSSIRARRNRVHELNVQKVELYIFDTYAAMLEWPDKLLVLLTNVVILQYQGQSYCGAYVFGSLVA